jgi:hypothetical protein
LKAITIIGTLITVIVIGYVAVTYLNAATAPVINVPSVNAPYGDGSENPQNAIDAARSIVSMDKDRQRDMQNIMDKIDGVGTGQ